MFETLATSFSGLKNKIPFLLLKNNQILCNTKMIMSYLAKIEMSAFKEAIIPDLRGGYYGRKGHNHGESKGIKA
ncbi:MAG: hypothetical protein Q7J27_12340, partial [Syntrophales bacterium]|nr:hypothetical protein [Syntrophales bacterium]